MKYGIVLANDVLDFEKSLALSEETAPFLDAIKIGITTTLKPGTDVFRKTKEKTGKVLLADFKVADIGHKNKEGKWEGTNNKIVRELVSSGADYVICHTIIGTSSIQECVDTAHESGGKVLTLPYMTHKGADVFFDLPFAPENEIRSLSEQYPDIMSKIAKLNIEKGTEDEEAGWRLPYVSISDVILLLGEEIGVDGYIGPANNPAVLNDSVSLIAPPPC